MDNTALAGYLGNDAGVKNVIDIFGHDKSKKMPYKTGYAPRWVFVVLGFVFSVIQAEGVICREKR